MHVKPFKLFELLFLVTKQLQLNRPENAKTIHTIKTIE